LTKSTSVHKKFDQLHSSVATALPQLYSDTDSKVKEINRNVEFL